MDRKRLIEAIVEFHEGYGWAAADLADVRERCEAMNDDRLQAEFDRHNAIFLAGADPFKHARLPQTG